VQTNSLPKLQRVVAWILGEPMEMVKSRFEDRPMAGLQLLVGLPQKCPACLRSGWRLGRGSKGSKFQGILQHAAGNVYAVYEMFVILACAKECTGMAYISENIYIHQIARQLCRPLRQWGWCQSLSGNVEKHSVPLSSWNKVMLLSVPSVPGHCGIQGNEDADALAREGSSRPFLGPKPEISISPCVSRLMVNPSMQHDI
jgi:hypothetical protein